MAVVLQGFGKLLQFPCFPRRLWQQRPDSDAGRGWRQRVWRLHRQELGWKCLWVLIIRSTDVLKIFTDSNIVRAEGGGEKIHARLSRLFYLLIGLNYWDIVPHKRSSLRRIWTKHRYSPSAKQRRFPCSDPLRRPRDSLQFSVIGRFLFRFFRSSRLVETLAPVPLRQATKIKAPEIVQTADLVRNIWPWVLPWWRFALRKTLFKEDIYVPLGWQKFRRDLAKFRPPIWIFRTAGDDRWSTVSSPPVISCDLGKWRDTFVLSPR